MGLFRLHPDEGELRSCQAMPFPSVGKEEVALATGAKIGSFDLFPKDPFSFQMGDIDPHEIDSPPALTTRDGEGHPF